MKLVLESAPMRPFGLWVRLVSRPCIEDNSWHRGDRPSVPFATHPHALCPSSLLLPIMWAALSSYVIITVPP